MALYDDTEPPDDREPPSLWRWLVALSLAGLALGAGWLVSERERADTPEPARVSAPRPAGPKTVPPAASIQPVPRPEPSSRGTAPRVGHPAPSASETPAPAVAAAAPRLRVTSDVPGAFVFLDRKYLGTTPLETSDVATGSHQLKVAAEGYDGVDRSVDIADGQPTEVAVQLKAVVLDAHVAVVHKHTVGSCEGTLSATTGGLRYETSHAEDAFNVPLDQLDTFALDYLKKSLRVKARNGRTWNFTTREASADPLLVFQRQVDGARAKLRNAP